jgi:hypothetical protein
VAFDWTGCWRVDATIPGGGVYDGRIEIAPYGHGFRLVWKISDGDYFGVGLATPAGLYVSCGPKIAGLSVLVFGREERGRLLTVNDGGGAQGLAIDAKVESDDRVTLSGGGLVSARIISNGESKLAEIKARDGAHQGLAVWGSQSAALAWGAPLERLVILFYETPAAPDGPVNGVWALGRHRDLGVERLVRVR